MRKHTLSLAFAALLFSASAVSVEAAEYPVKPIQVIVPWAAGGGHDISARVIAEGAKKYLSEPMVITNLTGAAGLNAYQKTLKSPADGYTLLWEHAANLITTPLIAKAKFSWKDFEIIGSIGSTPLTIFVKNDARWKDMSEVIAEMKAKPGQVRWCTTPNSASGFSLYAVEEAAGGFTPLMVPSQGDKNRIISVLGGNSDIATAGISSIVPYMKSGDVRVLAMLSKERSPFAPEIPTLIEQGINSTTEYMFCILVPKGIPDNIKKTLASAMEKTVNDSDVVESLARQGIAAKWRDSTETVNIWEEEGAMYVRLAKAHKLIR